MIPDAKTDLDRSLSRRYAILADEDRVKRTTAALEANGIEVVRAPSAEDARRIVFGLIPAGSEVHHGASQSLEESGIAAELEKASGFELIRPRIWSMDRETQADEI